MVRRVALTRASSLAVVSIPVPSTPAPSTNVSIASSDRRGPARRCLYRRRFHLRGVPCNPAMLDVNRCRSVISRAAVDVDRLAGDEAAIVGNQEQAGRGDFVDLALTAKRN